MPGRKVLKKRIFKLLRKKGVKFQEAVELATILSKFLRDGYADFELNDRLRKYVKWVRCGCSDPQCYDYILDWEKIPVSKEELTNHAFK